MKKNKCEKCNCDCHCSLQEHSDLYGYALVKNVIVINQLLLIAIMNVKLANKSSIL